MPSLWRPQQAYYQPQQPGYAISPQEGYPPYPPQEGYPPQAHPPGFYPDPTPSLGQQAAQEQQQKGADKSAAAWEAVRAVRDILW